MIKVIIFIVTVVIILIIGIVKLYYDKNKQQKKEEMQVQYIDRLTTKPVEISIKAIEKFINDTIDNYVASIYSLDPTKLPYEHMTQEFCAITYKEMKRQYDLGIRNELISYKPLGRYKIKQNNSAIYTVTELHVFCNYQVEYKTYHTTFRKHINKTVEQEIIFTGTNQGFFLNELVHETIISKEEKSID